MDTFFASNKSQENLPLDIVKLMFCQEVLSGSIGSITGSRAGQRLKFKAIQLNLCSCPDKGVERLVCVGVQHVSLTMVSL